MAARLKAGETLGDRIMKVDHAGEHGAVCVYRAQRMIARWRAREMLAELDEFIAHEVGHREIFKGELDRRGLHRCRSYLLCGLGGFALGIFTGLAGSQAIAATTIAIERVVLRHMHEQIDQLDGIDVAATEALRNVIRDEQSHYDLSQARLNSSRFWPFIIKPVVSISTEAVIWLGMKL